MYLGKLGFFKEKQAIEKQNLKNHFDQVASNLKNNNLKKVLLARLQQELYFLTLYATPKIKMAAKKKRLLCKLKYSMRKRRAKSRAIINRRHTVDSMKKISITSAASSGRLKVNEGSFKAEPGIVLWYALRGGLSAADKPLSRNSLR